MKKTSILIGIGNDFELTNNFFEHLLALPNISDYEIISIVDGDYSYRTLKYLQQKSKNHPNFQYQCLNERKGYSKVNNFAASIATNDFLLFINSDVFPTSGSIEGMSSYLQNNPSVGLVQGLLLYPQNDTVQSTGHIFGSYFNRHALEGRSRNDSLVNKIQERQGLTSAFYMIDRNLFTDLGGFDEFYFNSWDGLDFSLKVYFSGKKCIYYPKSVGYHIRGGTRNFIANNESQQSAYFWSKWGKLLKNDLVNILNSQLTKVKCHNSFLVINCSLITELEDFIDLLEVKYSTIISIRDRFSNKIDLYLNLSHAIQNYRGDLLFVVNNFMEIKRNRRWILARNNKNDLVVDFSGNIFSLIDIV